MTSQIILANGWPVWGTRGAAPAKAYDPHDAYDSLERGHHLVMLGTLGQAQHYSQSRQCSPVYPATLFALVAQ